MLGRFTSVELQGNALKVTGTFDPQDPRVDHATILFLVVQGKDAAMVWTHGAGEWKRQNGSQWTGTAPATGKGASGGPGTIQHAGGDNDRVRGIAMALVVLPAQERPPAGSGKFDPPTIQALTWCATTVLT
jgi:hypothetical protein